MTLRPPTALDGAGRSFGAWTRNLGQVLHRYGQAEWFGSPFHLLSLRSPRASGAAAAPRSPRPVHAQRGLQIIAGTITLAGQNPVRDLVDGFAGFQADPAERELLNRIPECLRELGRLPEFDRAEIQTVLGKITRAQELDLERFCDGTELRALESAGQLDEYTYLIAGCVGEFWTEMCFQHLQGFADLPEQGFGDHAVKRHDDAEIGAPAPVMGENQGGGGHLLAVVRGRNIHDNAEIEVMVVEPGDQSLRRLAQHREQSDHAAGTCVIRTRAFQAERRDDRVPQIQQGLDPTRIARKHPFGGGACVERCVSDGHPESVGELRIHFLDLNADAAAGRVCATNRAMQMNTVALAATK